MSVPSNEGSSPSVAANVFPPRIINAPCAADVRLRKLAEEKDELLAQIRKLKNQLEEEKQKHSKVDGAFTDGESLENGTDLHFIEMQRKFIPFSHLNINDKIISLIGFFLYPL